MHDFDETYLNRVSLIRPGILPKSYGLPDRPFQKNWALVSEDWRIYVVQKRCVTYYEAQSCERIGRVVADEVGLSLHITELDLFMNYAELTLFHFLFTF